MYAQLKNWHFERLFSFLLAVYSFRCKQPDFSSFRAQTIEFLLTLFAKAEPRDLTGKHWAENPAVLFLLLLLLFWVNKNNVLGGVGEPLSLASWLITDRKEKTQSREWHSTNTFAKYNSYAHVISLVQNV